MYAEGSNGIAKRVRAWLKKRKVEPGALANFKGIPAAVDMLDGASVKRLVTTIRKWSATRGGAVPKLIVLDTLQRCFGVGNENSTQDMAAFIQGCDKVRRAFPGSVVLVLHHTGWALGDIRVRGSSALHGAADTEIGIAERDGDKIGLKIVKQKNFKEDARLFWLELRDVEGTNSAVLRPAEPPPPKKKDDNKAKVLQALGAVYPGGLRPGELAAQSGVGVNTLKGVRKRMVKDGEIREDGVRIYQILKCSAAIRMGRRRQSG